MVIQGHLWIEELDLNQVQRVMLDPSFQSSQTFLNIKVFSLNCTIILYSTILIFVTCIKVKVNVWNCSGISFHCKESDREKDKAEIHSQKQNNLCFFRFGTFRVILEI